MVEIVAELMHLAPDAIWVAVFDIYPGFYAAILEDFAYFAAEHLEPFGLRPAVAFDEACQLLVFMRTAEAETEILEFGLDVVETEAVCERSIEIVGLAGDFHLFVGAHGGESAHVVKPVGELYEYGADVVLDGVEHLLEIVELTRHLVFLFFLLRDHADEKCHVVAEPFADIVDGIVGILDHIVEESGDYGICAEA